MGTQTRYFVKSGSDKVRTMPPGIMVKGVGKYFDTEEEALTYIKEQKEKEKEKEETK